MIDSLITEDCNFRQNCYKTLVNKYSVDKIGTYENFTRVYCDYPVNRLFWYDDLKDAGIEIGDCDESINKIKLRAIIHKGKECLISVALYNKRDKD